MQHPGGCRVFYIPLVTALITLALFFAAVSGGWFGEWKGTGSEYCEASRPGLIKQPVNTWSNLCFVCAGLLMAWLLWRGVYARNVNAMTRSRFYPVFYTSLVIVVGPCSMAMHATETPLGAWFDKLSMHLVVSFITAYALQRFLRMGPVTFTLIFAALMALCVGSQEIHWRMPVVMQVDSLVFVLLIAATTIVEALNTFVRRMDHRLVWSLLSLASILAAFTVWGISQTGCAWCDPYSVIQGHGLWHLLCALSLLFLFRYYVSENPKPRV